jgi:hypothetical protein
MAVGCAGGSGLQLDASAEAASVDAADAAQSGSPMDGAADAAADAQLGADVAAEPDLTPLDGPSVPAPDAGDGGAGAGLVIDPGAVDFGNACTSKPAVFRVTNRATEPLSPLVAQTTHDAFRLVRNDCVGALDPGKSCEVEVQLLQLSGLGKITGTLTVSAPGSTVMASLQGEVPSTDGFLSLTSPIPDTPVGQQSAPVEVVVPNPLAAPPAKLDWIVAGVSAAEYTVTTDDCNRPVPAGGACRLHIVFAPTGTGVRTASLLVYETECPRTSAVVPLAGIGTTP